MTDTIIFDFDGTIAVGDGPIRAFARTLAGLLPDAVGSGFLAGALAGLSIAASEGFTADDRDGYGLIRRHALAAGASTDALEEAYQHSRSVLGSDEAPISAPEGLREFLDTLPDGVRAVLVTNAPPTNIDFAIDHLGLTGCFAEVRHSARKPDGLIEIAQPWCDGGRVLSVGDIWVNDLMPIEYLGGDTALIGDPAPATNPSYSAQTLEALLPQLAEWARARRAQRVAPLQHASSPHHPPTQHSSI